MRHIARKTGAKPASVYGVATFYTQFRLKPVGRHVILLCQGTACHVNGPDSVLPARRTRLRTAAWWRCPWAYP